MSTDYEHLRKNNRDFSAEDREDSLRLEEFKAFMKEAPYIIGTIAVSGPIFTLAVLTLLHNVSAPSPAPQPNDFSPVACVRTLPFTPA